jgi:hypothetical protein
MYQMFRVTANQVCCSVVIGLKFQICFELYLYHYYCITVITVTVAGVVDIKFQGLLTAVFVIF